MAREITQLVPNFSPLWVLILKSGRFLSTKITLPDVHLDTKADFSE
jgi:hypothetical protein